MWLKITYTQHLIKRYSHKVWGMAAQIWGKRDWERTHAGVHGGAAGYKSGSEEGVSNFIAWGGVLEWRADWAECVTKKTECI